MKGTGTTAFAGIALVAAILSAGCSTVRLAGREGAPPEGGPPAADGGEAKGRPFFLLSLGAPKETTTPSPAPPFSYTDETAGRWLVLFELSYPAGEKAPPGR